LGGPFGRPGLPPLFGIAQCYGAPDRDAILGEPTHRPNPL